LNRTGDIARPRGEAARERAALELIARHEQALKRTARRFSLNADDAEDAYQRALEIVLTKAPTTDPRELIRWTQTVTRHEALAVRRSRERLLGKQPLSGTDGTPIDPLTLVPSPVDGPGEQVERREEIARSREALRRLKPAELRALSLLAEGYSYAEIGEITDFSHTKINRLLAEGRSRFRDLVSSSEDGTRCRELRPLLSAFCDGEAQPADAEIVREHLRACAHCRATMRAYRAAPRLAGALVPALAPVRSLLGRLHDAALRLGSQISGTGKLVAGCAVGAAGCAAVVLPAPIPHPASTPSPIERVVPRPRQGPAAQAIHRSRPRMPGKAHRKPERIRRGRGEDTGAAIEAETAPEPIEYEPAPPAEPAVSPAGSESTATESSDSAAGEFGP
jgi:RNA polymerase sigma factor (sigma-70 family)